MGLVVVVVLGDLFEVEAVVPSIFLHLMTGTFSLNLWMIPIWFRDLLRLILVMESSDWPEL